MTRILAFSDLHLSRSHADALVAESAAADLVVGAGDYCNMRAGLGEAMALLDGITAPLVMVPGNAESAAELAAVAPGNAVVLHGEAVDIAGLTLFGLGYGVPLTPFGAWSCDLTEDQAAELLDPMNAVDILVSHSPPKGVADVTSAGQSVGSVAVHDAVERAQPRLVFCGHIHDSWGSSGHIGRSVVHNLGPTPNWFEL
ncbi:MAG: metallophosphoesterase [Pseudomonadota bacterium]